MQVCARMLTAAVALLPSMAVLADLPYEPALDTDVLLVIDRRSDQREAELRRQFEYEPGNPALAARLAAYYTEEARRRSDPRYLGYAEAVLTPWQNQQAAPGAVRLRRAIIDQHRHRFEAAAADLTGLLAAEPRNDRAWFTLAMVRVAQGDYDAAGRACRGVSRHGEITLAAACHAQVIGLSGEAARAYAILSALHRTVANRELEIWILAGQADLARRLRRPAVAEVHLREALALAPDDSPVLRQLSDLLLDGGRHAELCELLENRSPATLDDGLLLRALLALRVAGSPVQASLYERRFRQRMAAARLRGSTLHRLDAARFAFEIDRAPQRALELAMQDWVFQKSSESARLILEAALALQDAGAAEPAQAWIRDSRIEDAALSALAARL